MEAWFTCRAFLLRGRIVDRGVCTEISDGPTAGVTWEGLACLRGLKILSERNLSIELKNGSNGCCGMLRLLRQLRVAEDVAEDVGEVVAACCPGEVVAAAEGRPNLTPWA